MKISDRDKPHARIDAELYAQVSQAASQWGLGKTRTIEFLVKIGLLALPVFEEVIAAQQEKDKKPPESPRESNDHIT
ncbi:hypothetical protein [Merismopedia glauca]|uniref:Uncharacterized protein n=2 Tax=Merismopedia TaxID=53402 RepID=A0A2T1BY61_9CYAN|nr:hypothetical protein [Merismopedia glauca]PSB00838.1 hypothetical protein C7B64_21435 [Merismopedia glauca CCAP 1448/3]